jgi:hypothetical protein
MEIQKRHRDMAVALVGTTPIGGITHFLMPKAKKDGAKELLLQADAAIRSAPPRPAPRPTQTGRPR